MFVGLATEKPLGIPPLPVPPALQYESIVPFLKAGKWTPTRFPPTAPEEPPAKRPKPQPSPPGPDGDEAHASPPHLYSIPEPEDSGYGEPLRHNQQHLSNDVLAGNASSSSCVHPPYIHDPMHEFGADDDETEDRSTHFVSFDGACRMDFERLVLEPGRLFPRKDPLYRQHSLMADGELKTKLLDPEYKVLVVADEDFSFGMSLARLRGTGQNLVITATKPRTSVHHMYPKFASRRIQLLMMGCTLGYHVDHSKPLLFTATASLAKLDLPERFDLVVWNFPYASTRNGLEGLEKEALQRLGDFIPNVLSAMACGCLLWIALKDQAFFRNWGRCCGQYATDTGALMELEPVPFQPGLWKEYMHTADGVAMRSTIWLWKYKLALPKALPEPKGLCRVSYRAEALSPNVDKVTVLAREDNKSWGIDRREWQQSQYGGAVQPAAPRPAPPKDKPSGISDELRAELIRKMMGKPASPAGPAPTASSAAKSPMPGAAPRSPQAASAPTRGRAAAPPKAAAGRPKAAKAQAAVSILEIGSDDDSPAPPPPAPKPPGPKKAAPKRAVKPYSGPDVNISNKDEDGAICLSD